jgi:integrase
MIDLLSQALELINEANAMKYKLRKGNSQSPFYEVRFYYEGKQYTRSTRTTKKKEANQIAREIISQIISKQKFPQTLGSHSLDEAIQTRGEELSKNEKLNIKRVRSLNPKLFKQPMATITTDDLWALKMKYKKQRSKILGRELKGQSINRAFAFIYSTFNEALKWGWIDTAPHHRKLKVSPPVPREALTDEEIQVLKETCFQVGDKPLWRIFQTYLNSGLRREELHELKREHVVYDGEAILLLEQKNGEFNQEFPVNDVVKEILNEQLRSHNQEYVFDFTNFRRRFERVFKESEVKTNIHSFRHTAITRVAMTCEGLAELQNFSRHKSLTALQKYIHHVERTTRRKIANKIKIT